MSFIVWKTPQPVSRRILQKAAKKLSEQCCKQSPDSNFQCTLAYEGDPAPEDHLHHQLNEDGQKVAEWFDSDMSRPADVTVEDG